VRIKTAGHTLDTSKVPESRRPRLVCTNRSLKPQVSETLTAKSGAA
jgi:hypothetical protein